MSYKEVIKYIGYCLGYIGFSYVIYILFRITCEINIKFEDVTPTNTLTYKVKCLLLDISNNIIIAISFFAIIPLVISGIDSYFNNRMLKRYDRDLARERLGEYEASEKYRNGNYYT